MLQRSTQNLRTVVQWPASLIELIPFSGEGMKRRALDRYRQPESRQRLEESQLLRRGAVFHYHLQVEERKQERRGQTQSGRRPDDSRRHKGSYARCRRPISSGKDGPKSTSGTRG